MFLVYILGMQFGLPLHECTGVMYRPEVMALSGRESFDLSDVGAIGVMLDYMITMAND